MRHAIKDSKIQQVGDKEPDYELASPSQFFGSHVNLIPLHSAVQGPRLFYGARFIDQAMPLVNPEAALVQNLDDQDPDGRSFDEHAGVHAGALRSRHAGEVVAIDPDRIVVRDAEGKEQEHQTYNNFSFNRKSAIHNTAVVKPGDKVKAGQLLAHSNYTDKDGTLAMGLNARIALIPFKGWSMDDAQVISDSFARRLLSEATSTYAQDFDDDIKGG
ncbi:MAG: rpoB, partial [Verrucomicrobiaceae bacterium]|nr:rpoB [Verrucomicrobiaceae bacterium]